MVETQTLLRSFLQGLRFLSNARAASVYIPASGSGAEGRLIHDGEADPVPELADLDAARGFVAAAKLRSAESEGDGRDLMRQFPSSSPAARLVRVPALEALIALSTRGKLRTARRRGDRQPAAAPDFATAWIGLSFASREECDEFSSAAGPLTLPTPQLGQARKREWWGWILTLGTALVWHVQRSSELLDDPVSGLPGRQAFQGLLSHEMARAARSGRRLTLALVNPDDFSLVNDLLGREAGDRIIREIGRRLRSSLRGTDVVGKYGGAIFAAILPETPLADGRQVMEKIRRHLEGETYHDGSLRLAFSAGLSEYRSGRMKIESAADLILMAHRALSAAKRAGGGRVVALEKAQPGDDDVSRFDQLSGIFTADSARDYRNMFLLWNAVQSMATSNDSPSLAGHVARGIRAAFKPHKVAVFARTENADLEVVRVLVAGQEGKPAPGAAAPGAAAPALAEHERRLTAEARQSRQPVQESAASEGAGYRCAVPLVAGDVELGCLYLEGEADQAGLDSSDLSFLQALAGQLAVALDRANLTAREQARQRAEQERLREEVETLRTAIEEAKLVYRSSEMESVLALARRVAPTDATVLITGESGTGKELVARTIHEMSERRKGPRVVVDCTALADTLVDSELFGHERGAFTGAGKRSRGRLVEADGGTVVLDEVSELPLPSQAKLLRFVQEKQLTPVGGSKPRTVDARIIACTNRDLGAEVEAGRFRADLYHRLNVMVLAIPPLRQRRDDILFLAQHFLGVYSVLYQRKVRRLSSAAEGRLLRCGWPGNVRELQNCIMRAVILCDGDELGAQDLTLDQSAGERESAAPPPTPSPAADDLLWDELRQVLARMVREISDQAAEPPPALGIWLKDELLLRADERAEGNARLAAEILGMPRTSYRRLHARTRNRQRPAPEPSLAALWEEARRLVARIVAAVRPGELDLPRRAEETLLRAVSEQGDLPARRGAALLGVSTPTFRHRAAALAKS